MEPSAALPRSRAFLAVAGVCAAGVPLALLYSRPGSPTGGTIVALVAQAAMAGALAWSERFEPTPALRVTRLVVLGFVGLLTGWSGYHFGPNGTFAGVLTLVLALSGVLSSPGTRNAPGGWLIYATVAGSQAVVLALVAGRVLDDAGFTPVILGSRPMRSHILGHVFVQAIYLSAFMAGRAFARRYRALAAELERAERAEVVREALLEEARARYRHALRRARERDDLPEPGLSEPGFSQPTPAPSEPPTPTKMAKPETRGRGLEIATLQLSVSDEVTLPRVSAPPPEGDTEPSAPAAPREIPTQPPDAAPEAWGDAGKFRMRRVLGLTLGACAAGAVLLGAIAVDRTGLYVAWIGIAGIAAALVVHNVSATLGPRTWWAWTAGALFSVGPAYSIGLHSGFVGIVVGLLFLGDLFRAPIRDGERDKRYRVYVGSAVAHAVAFGLIVGGVIEDLGNVPVRLPGVPTWQLVAQHVYVQAVYLAAYAAGRLVDRRQAQLMQEAAEAVRRAASQEASLTEAKAALQDVLDTDREAIFEDADVGPYRAERLLGRGGMGDVYSAMHRETGQRVALKLIRRERAADPRALKSFNAEAQALARVRSPHVANVLDVSDEDAELPYLAMELMEGSTLADVLRDRRRLPLEEVAPLVRDIARGLADSHEAGVLHLDLKPHNIARATDERGEPWKLLDFGIAQMASLMSARRSVIAGTPGYMAPEQALAEPLDARSDLYSLCLVVYRALTGRPAFIGDDPLALARSAHMRPAPDPRWYVPLPKDVERVLRLGLAADPDLRLTTAKELGEAFAAACDEELPEAIRARADALLREKPWTDPGEVHLPATGPEEPTAIKTAAPAETVDGAGGPGRDVERA